MPVVFVGFDDGEEGALPLDVVDIATGRFFPVSSNRFAVSARTSVMNWPYEGVVRVAAWVLADFFNRVDARVRIVASAVRSAMTARTL